MSTYDLHLLQEQVFDQDLDSVAHNNIQRIHQDLILQGHTRLNQHREPLIVVRRQRSAETSCRRTTKDLELRSGSGGRLGPISYHIFAGENGLDKIEELELLRYFISSSIRFEFINLCKSHF